MKFVRTISEVAFAAMLLISASCAVTGDDPREDPSPEATAETAASVETQVAVPDQLQLTPAATPTCKSKHGVCIGLKLCNEENDHHPIVATGCSSTTVCCVAG
jgi:hypothetical protein